MQHTPLNISTNLKKKKNKTKPITSEDRIKTWQFKSGIIMSGFYIFRDRSILFYTNNF